MEGWKEGVIYYISYQCSVLCVEMTWHVQMRISKHRRCNRQHGLALLVEHFMSLGHSDNDIGPRKTAKLHNKFNF